MCDPELGEARFTRHTNGFSKKPENAPGDGRWHRDTPHQPKPARKPASGRSDAPWPGARSHANSPLGPTGWPFTSLPAAAGIENLGHGGRCKEGGL